MNNHEAKMPEMPPAAYVGVQRGEYVAHYSADQMRAMYLAALAEAKMAVPPLQRCHVFNDAEERAAVYAHNHCREVTIDRIVALERTASGADFPKKEEAKK